MQLLLAHYISKSFPGYSEIHLLSLHKYVLQIHISVRILNQ